MAKLARPKYDTITKKGRRSQRVGSRGFLARELLDYWESVKNSTRAHRRVVQLCTNEVLPKQLLEFSNYNKDVIVATGLFASRLRIIRVRSGIVSDAWGRSGLIQGLLRMSDSFGLICEII